MDITFINDQGAANSSDAESNLFVVHHPSTTISLFAERGNKNRVMELRHGVLYFGYLYRME